VNVNYDYSKLVVCIHYWRRRRHPRTHTVPSVDISSLFVVDANRKVDIYHKSMKDFLTNEEMMEDSDFFIDVEEVENLFATRCLAILEKSNLLSESQRRDDGESIASYPREVTSYALRHVIQHMCACNMTEEARSMILDLGWLMTRVLAGEASEIEVDCYRLSNDPVAELIGRAVGLSLNALRIDARQLPGQLVGRLMSLVDDSLTINEIKINVRQELVLFITKLKAFDFGFGWFCPLKPTWEQAGQPCIKLLKDRTDEPIVCVAWSKDDSGRVATASQGGAIRVWNSNEGECELFLDQNDRINALAWSSESANLLCGSYNGNVDVFDSISGTKETSFRHNEFAVMCLDVSNDNDVCSGHDKVIYVWCMTTGNIKYLLEKHTKRVRSLSLLNGGPTLASAGDDALLCTWNISDGTCTCLISGHSASITSVCFMNDNMLASGSLDRTVKVWNVSSQGGQVVHQLNHCPTEKAKFCSRVDLTSSPDNNSVIAFGTMSDNFAKEVVVYDIASCKDPPRCLGRQRGVHIPLHWGKNGIATGDEGGNLRLLDPSISMSATSTMLGDRLKSCRVWSPCGSIVASTSDDKSVSLWNPLSGGRVSVLRGHKGMVSV